MPLRCLLSECVIEKVYYILRKKYSPFPPFGDVITEEVRAPGYTEEKGAEEYGKQSL
jgi:hypothetical protein